MPVNSFENYPMSWKPDKKSLKYPIYISLAKLLESDITSGKLAANTKLPPQRELADFLDLNLSTITRAFKICEMRNLIYATVGKGTFVSPNAVLPATLYKKNGYINMGSICPFYQFNSIVADTAQKILLDKSANHLFEFDNSHVTTKHKEIAKNWLKKYHINTDIDNIIITAGSQNALVITLLALFNPGAKIATDIYTYPNFISLAKQLNIQLIPIKTDTEGMLPEELEKNVKMLDIKGIYLMPSCSNPTGITISVNRRQALCDIIKKYNLITIEDDTYGFINYQNIMPIAALLPDKTIYLHGLSKSLSAGLRIAYLVFPLSFKKYFLNTANNINLKMPLLNCEIASVLIEDGIADEIIEKKKLLSYQRNQIYRKYFPETTASNPYSFFQWLPLKKQQSGYDYELYASSHNVKVLCSERFGVGNTSNFSALRIATCSPISVDELENGLSIIQNLFLNGTTASM